MSALEGIRVVDFSRILAGPYCTMLLADLGAEVIKIEKPGTGDDSRAFGPFVAGESLYFISVNRGKKSIALNLKNQASREFLLGLIDTADVLVENFKPGVMERLGLSYDVLSARNPRLIYCSCSGYGHTGTYAQKPAYDLIIQGLTGMMSITGTEPGHPCKVGMSVADVDTGVYAAVGCLAALYQREKTGKGQHVDIAMFDVLMSILENAATQTLNTGKAPTAIGNRHPSICPYTTLRASDGFLNIAAANDELFTRLANTLETPEMATDPRFLTNASRLENRVELEAQLGSIIATKSVEEWCKRLDEAGIPAGPVNDMRQALAQPQVEERNTITTIHHPVAGDIQCIASALHLSSNPKPEYASSPMLGEDSVHYIAEIMGCSESEAAQLATSWQN